MRSEQMRDFGWKVNRYGEMAMPADKFLERLEYKPSEAAKELGIRSETIIFVPHIKPKR